MTILPLDKMIDQVEKRKNDGDTSLFLSLLYLGEFTTKLIVAGMVAAIVDGRERNQYQAKYKIVRAPSIGVWKEVLDDILIGPAAQFMLTSSQGCQRELTQNCKSGEWQYEAVQLLGQCLYLLDYPFDPLPKKVDCRLWFSLFTQLRNKSRGHGAPTPTKCSDACEPLYQSINLLIDNLSIFNIPWAYLRQNYSGKYRVTAYSEKIGQFQELKTNARINTPPLPEGVYIDFGEYCYVDLVESDPEASDFFVPNGSFTEKSFELLSYITDNRKTGDSSKYLLPAMDLPPSETEGHGELEIQGNCFGNIPPLDEKYISRPTVEKELFGALTDERHSIITLVGRGGIGKTWLAINVLHQISELKRFDTILWFSARDIDLLADGPKYVKPQVSDEKETASEFAKLISPRELHTKQFDPIKYMTECMTKPKLGPTLFVFDNFETVQNPGGFYSWIDTYIYNPNKVLITTRIRDFKADFDVSVPGMSSNEARKLIEINSIDLGISSIITDDYATQLIQESEGHPYVIKILLGEVAKTRKAVLVERIIAGSDELLKALFERTYINLSQGAKRVFLTLCNWKSVVSLLALEAVLIRPGNERLDFESAISELRRSSFIEEIGTGDPHEIFISVPLVAMLFGKKKLRVSNIKSEIDSDTEILREFGAISAIEAKAGLEPRIIRIFNYVGELISKDQELLKEYMPMLEFIARKYPKAWLRIAELYEESGIEKNYEKAKEAVESYLSEPGAITDQQKAWKMLALFRRNTEDYFGEIHALIEYCKLPGITAIEISNTANRLNMIFNLHHSFSEKSGKSLLISNLLEIVDNMIDEFTAVDFSRFAWLALNNQDRVKALGYIDYGLSLDPENTYIKSLASTLGVY